MKKSSTAGDNWYLYDYKREAEYNPHTQPLFPDGTYGEQGDLRPVDFVSNGFKIKTTGSWINANGATIVYMAFASNPFKTARAR